jgi:hypothetical protein
VHHKVVFGFSYQTARTLVDFPQHHRRDLRHVTGVRYSGERRHPFHVVDDEVVVLPLDHPFVKEGWFASPLLRDRRGSSTKGFGHGTTKPRALRAMAQHNLASLGDPKPDIAAPETRRKTPRRQREALRSAISGDGSQPVTV